ncbi:helix-turn-helix domain-containing protein [Rhodoplanes sp. Z2-YC6860]|uniref:helix-turn-helix domain-containing protein n=1 Tax=Rhodoplanes sp. Z2-YC6860 TaxID=674703 RepID=UPI0008361ADD|nr:helix-turn-helix domain-containing protein [Rhodoplanes sp. Z2-YC6860]
METEHDGTSSEVVLQPHVLTVEEWAARMRISRTAAYAAIRNGDVKVIRIGRTIRIPNKPAAA